MGVLQASYEKTRGLRPTRATMRARGAGNQLPLGEIPHPRVYSTSGDVRENRGRQSQLERPPNTGKYKTVDGRNIQTLEQIEPPLPPLMQCCAKISRGSANGRKYSDPPRHFQGGALASTLQRGGRGDGGRSLEGLNISSIYCLGLCIFHRISKRGGGTNFREVTDQLAQ